MNFPDFVETLDSWGRSKTPFFFLIDFDQQKPLAFKLADVPADIAYDFNGKTNRASQTSNFSTTVTPVIMDEREFKRKFDLVHKHLMYGDSYLINLTVRHPIQINADLKTVFDSAIAKYKLLLNDQFLVFSPETFIQIVDGTVYAYPMKGTIDASIENAEQIILANSKELAEHVTIVDLIRNDLSLVSDNVKVTRFRYVEKIVSNNKPLLQVSSQIEGRLSAEYERSFGSILAKLLPAGSISGAPKPKTVQIIQQVEQMARGYYTGVAGIYDGKVFDSGVLIRFIENENGQFFYRSGGGITTLSDWREEYREVIDKIYVPVN